MIRTFVASCVLIILIPWFGNAEVWNVGDDFSTTMNPNGAWSYGWYGDKALSSDWRYDNPYVLHTIFDSFHCDPDPDAWDQWYTPITQDHLPCVTHNPHDHTIACVSTGTLTFPPNSVSFHPSPWHESVIRWTAPYAMNVAITCSFSAANTCHGYSWVHVYRHGWILFTGNLSGFPSTASYEEMFAVQAGEVIDCVVEPGSYLCGSVLVDITFENPVSAQGASWGAVKAMYR